VTDGALGAQPALYKLERAAKWLGVAPWDLLERQSFWLTSALEYAQVEAEALQERQAAEG
jgi:hypothetical protein